MFIITSVDHKATVPPAIPAPIQGQIHVVNTPKIINNNAYIPKPPESDAATKTPDPNMIQFIKANFSMKFDELILSFINTKSVTIESILFIYL